MQRAARIQSLVGGRNGAVMGTKRIRVEFGEPVIIAGKYRVSVLRRGTKDEWKVETVRWIDGQPVCVATTESVEVLIDQPPPEN
jgi:hypothetical protein